MRAFAEWLSSTSPSVAIQSAFWLIRLLQATHLVTAGVVTVSGLMIALHVLGLQRADQPFEAVRARFAPWLLASLGIMVVTGLAQSLGDPVRELTSFSYWLKLTLVLAAALGTWLTLRAARRAPAADGRPFAVRLAAAGLVVLWLVIPLLGRVIAYDRAVWGSWSGRT
jgi:hypothetical protein